MTMTKAEKEMIEHYKYLMSLRWTDPVKPDVPIPEGSGELSKGFYPIASQSDSARVDIACSSSVFHAIGSNTKTNSQRAMPLYSTRMLALRALRHQVENYCAKLLRRVDVQIEAEQSKLSE